MGSAFAHQSEASFLTGVPGAGRPGFRNTISLDQFAADRIGSQTRFPALTLSGAMSGLSWTRTGALVPADTSPSKVFARLFLEGRSDAVQLRRIEDGQSILDDVRDQASALRSDLGTLSHAHDALARERFLWEERYHAANGELTALRGELEGSRADRGRVDAEVQRLYEQEGELRAAVEDQTAHIGRTYAEIERLNGLLREMEATRAWRLHQWLSRRSS